MYKVWNESKEDYMQVDEEWMEGVNTENAKEFKYSSLADKLEVIYKNGKVVCYQNVHGTWGFPITVK